MYWYSGTVSDETENRNQPEITCIVGHGDRIYCAAVFHQFDRLIAAVFTRDGGDGYYAGGASGVCAGTVFGAAIFEDGAWGLSVFGAAAVSSEQIVCLSIFSSCCCLELSG